MAAEIQLQGQAVVPAQSTCRTPCRWEKDDWLAGGLLVAAALLTFGPVLECGFINYGDPAFVAGNDKLRAGLTWEGLSWACTSAYSDMLLEPREDVSSVPWQPLVWWTFLLDYQLHGPNPWGYHLTSLLWHLGSTLVLFIALRSLSGCTWASFGAAAHLPRLRALAGGAGILHRRPRRMLRLPPHLHRLRTCAKFLTASPVPDDKTDAPERFRRPLTPHRGVLIL